VERIHSVIREGKVYGMVALIASIVWITGYSARIDQQWQYTVWLSALHTDDHSATVELEPLYLDGVKTAGVAEAE